VSFSTAAKAGDVTDALQALRGIGPWTAQYIAMRALGEPDAFPSGDLILRRMAGDCTARALDERSERWRPWRSYAVMLLWQAAKEPVLNKGRRGESSRQRPVAGRKVMDGSRR